MDIDDNLHGALGTWREIKAFKSLWTSSKKVNLAISIRDIHVMDMGTETGNIPFGCQEDIEPGGLCCINPSSHKI
jgi:hypothetical protein